jgi:4-hydroxybenzoate polyprenyltransferase
LAKWLIFIKERFSPAVYVPTILAFVSANTLFFAFVFKQDIVVWRLIIILVLQSVFFFRMRLFDEIKDFETDIKINPGRPLARGLLTPKDVWQLAVRLMIFEVTLVMALGLWPAVIYIFALIYSLLMYKEFYIGDILRPYLTTYAVTHTAVSALLSLSIGIGITNISLDRMSVILICFALHNWCYFNLFEFARKTFCKIEERESVASYSNTFGTKGALMLSLSQVGIGLMLLAYAFQSVGLSLNYIFAAGGIYTLLSLPFGLRANPMTAQLFRASSGAYLLIHLILISQSVWSLK